VKPPLGLVSLSFALLVLAACGDDGEGSSTDTTAPAASDGGDGGDGGDGTIAVRLEEAEGIFIEGFEVGLRFTDAATGEEIERVVWSDFVSSLGSGDVDAFYTSVLEQPVSAGTVRVGADVNIGIGPGPEPPDLDASSLPCELDVEVPAGETVTVEVAFDDASPECLRIVDA
jgi:hypothetical protein